MLKTHVLTINEKIFEPEDGLILGNGDLSVSIYQKSDQIIWRFGKGDVWDRRLDLSDDPRPAHIDEVARGIKEEGWKCGPYGGPVEATKGSANPQRMKELCQGCPPSYEHRPYPCPKPVGELAMHLPQDQMGLKITQTLTIEEGTIEIVCQWDSGLVLKVVCTIPPTPNVLVVRWQFENWTPQTRTGEGVPVTRFALYRWADPSDEEYKEKYFGQFRHPIAAIRGGPKVTPLPPPEVVEDRGQWAIKQTFPADLTFPEGFEYRLVPLAPGLKMEPIPKPRTREAMLHLLPSVEAIEGMLAVMVPATSDSESLRTQYRNLTESSVENQKKAFSQWFDSARNAAKEFWAKSRVSISDPLLENLWYETLHVRRCAFRAGTVPPGLFLPSTIGDYSHWHGDYHMNYNFQSPFWGDYTANHPELGDAFFDGMKYFFQIGRKIARDYYNARGAFMQLSGYPIIAPDDVLGCVPMGRMAYMTGWVAPHFWWRYRYMMDQDWLREVGYPAMRDCALFYTDFLKKGSDGLYHAFPSNQGEDGFTGNPKDYTDRTQVIRHIRYCLRVTLAAAEVLKADPDLITTWREILDHLAPEEGDIERHRDTYRTESDEWFPPEFMSHEGDRRLQPLPPDKPGFFADPKSSYWLWYCGKIPWIWMMHLRNKVFLPDRDLSDLRRFITRWRHPNGILWAMAIAHYGHGGAWTETLGIIAPLQEMMLQSWEGMIRVFPAWPKNLDADFEQLRAEGAFLVSAAYQNGQVTHFKIKSLVGGPCTFANPWPGKTLRIADIESNKILTEQNSEIITLNTLRNKEYKVEKS